MIRKEICELIQFRLAGGVPQDSFEPTLDEINKWLDHGAAAAAMKNYTDGVQIDGMEYVADAFYLTTKGIALTKDSDSGYWTATLPNAPIGIPRGYDITSLYLQGSGRYSNSLVRLNPQQIDYYRSLPKPKNFIFYWPENDTLYIDSFADLTNEKAVVRMAGSAGKRLLTDKFLCPDDYIPFVVEYVFKQFLPKTNVPKDNLNDSVNP